LRLQQINFTRCWPLLYHYLLDITFAVPPILPDILLAADNLPDIAFAAPLFYWILTLAGVLILLDIVLAADQFYRCCLAVPPILLDITFAVHHLPDIALAADQFYQMLPLLHHYFTGYYTCSY